MSDEPSPTTPAEEPTEQRESHGVLATVLLVVFVVVIILLFWRSCSTSGDTEDVQSAGGSIQTIGELEPIEGGIAVWVKPGTSIEDVVSRHDLEAASIADMGDGTYVLGVATDDLDALVEELAEDPALYDAGFVYREE